MAYLMRYGHQPYSEIMRMPVDVMLSMYEEVGNIVKAENGKTDE